MYEWWFHILLFSLGVFMALQAIAEILDKEAQEEKAQEKKEKKEKKAKEKQQKQQQL